MSFLRIIIIIIAFSRTTYLMFQWHRLPSTLLITVNIFQSLQIQVLSSTFCSLWSDRCRGSLKFGHGTHVLILKFYQLSSIMIRFIFFLTRSVFIGCSLFYIYYWSFYMWVAIFLFYCLYPFFVFFFLLSLFVIFCLLFICPILSTHDHSFHYHLFSLLTSLSSLLILRKDKKYKNICMYLPICSLKNTSLHYLANMYAMR